MVVGTVTVELERAGGLSSASLYRLDIHRQPTAVPHPVRLTLELPDRWRASPASRRWERELQLDGDQSVDIGLQRRR